MGGRKRCGVGGTRNQRSGKCARECQQTIGIRVSKIDSSERHCTCVLHLHGISQRIARVHNAIAIRVNVSWREQVHCNCWRWRNHAISSAGH